jgi:hypothetical protein
MLESADLDNLRDATQGTYVKSNHKARFESWQRLCPEQTRILGSLVYSRLLPILERQGFVRVDVSLRDKDWPVSGREFKLERWGAIYVDSIEFNFDKYRAPRFQVHASRRVAEPPHPFVRQANLVARPSQYLHFWGKPWWLPIGIWSERASLRTVAGVDWFLVQLTHFLATGERGHNISRAVGPTTIN